MKKLIFSILFITAALAAAAQRKKIDSLRRVLSNTTNDTAKLSVLKSLNYYYFIVNPDSCIVFAHQAYELSVKYNRVDDKAHALNSLANAYTIISDYARGMSFYFRAIRAYQSINSVPGVVLEYNNIGATYIQQQNYVKALPYLKLAKKMWNNYLLSHRPAGYVQRSQSTIINVNFGECYLFQHKTDSADYYLQLSDSSAAKGNFSDLVGNIWRDLGEVETARGHKNAALGFFRKAVNVSQKNEDLQMLSVSYLSTSGLYHKYHQQDSAEYYAQKALHTASSGGYHQDALNAGKVLYTYYDEDHNLPLAYKYFKLTTAAKDSIYSQDRVKQLLALDFDEKQRQQEIVAAQDKYSEKIRTYALVAGLVILLLFVLIFWRSSAHRKSANLLLQRQKQAVEDAMLKLQLTQDQLIQAEKMASLGEMTAGIAHEIQNPLNFVNNFSEVSAELAQELKEELRNGRTADALSIADDLEQNLTKINYHGKRADTIVKGMLQHSRTGSGIKELTGINTLAAECMRLAYHGLRAKDKGFNTELVTRFGDNLPAINVVPQDISRAMLNLLNNAFYAVKQRAKTAGEAYKPVIAVTTSTRAESLLISVKDNGTGMPETVREKIMQPFFTTKPTGEGTGLGLSLTYDIVVKGHGGTLAVESREGEGSEFIISLPVN